MGVNDTVQNDIMSFNIFTRESDTFVLHDGHENVSLEFMILSFSSLKLIMNKE